MDPIVGVPRRRPDRRFQIWAATTGDGADLRAPYEGAGQRPIVRPSKAVLAVRGAPALRPRWAFMASLAAGISSTPNVSHASVGEVIVTTSGLIDKEAQVCASNVVKKGAPGTRVRPNVRPKVSRGLRQNLSASSVSASSPHKTAVLRLLEVRAVAASRRPEEVQEVAVAVKTLDGASGPRDVAREVLAHRCPLDGSSQKAVRHGVPNARQRQAAHRLAHAFVVPAVCASTAAMRLTPNGSSGLLPRRAATRVRLSVRQGVALPRQVAGVGTVPAPSTGTGFRPAPKASGAAATAAARAAHAVRTHVIRNSATHRIGRALRAQKTKEKPKPPLFRIRV